MATQLAVTSSVRVSNFDPVSGELRPHQISPYNRLREILAVHHTAVDLSKTGTGKTYVGACVASNSHLPTLVVGPKVARSAWLRAAEHFGDTISYVGYEMLRTGNTPFGKWSNGSGKREKYFKCQCCQRIVDLNRYEPCYCHPLGIHCLETKSKQHDYGTFLYAPEVKQIIFDEVHRCGALDSLNSDLLIQAKRQGKRVLALSATPASSPLQMKGLGYLLDLHNLEHDKILVSGSPRGVMPPVLPSFPRWLRHYHCRPDPRFRGWKWFASREDQKQIMLEIREQIIPNRGVMVTHDDIPGFPQCTIEAKLYDIETPGRVDELYAEVADALAVLAERSKLDVRPDSPLTRILRARQKIELLKVPIVTELLEDSLAKGLSCVAFVNFRQTIDELIKRFPEALVIDGTPESVAVRDKNLELFQANDCRMLVVNCEAGGVCLSMQDLTGECPRIGYVMPNYSAVSMQQVFGRLPRDGGKSPCFYEVLFVNGTVEVPVHRALTTKLNNLDALTDADLQPDNLRLARRVL